MQCKGFLFDLDGTLVDSLPAVERAWCNWADRFGLDHAEVLDAGRASAGLPGGDAGGAIADHPTIQVCDGTVGFLGLLNGIVGVLPEYSDRAGWGFISAEIDEAGRVLRFVRTGEDDD